MIELEKLEALALSADRDAALAGLLPGTVEHDYWRGIRLQHQGRLDEVDPILAAWQGRHGHTDEHHERLARRQLLLRAGQDLPAHADQLRFEAGVELDDEAEAAAAAQRYPNRLDASLIDEARLVDEAIRRSHDLTHLTDWALGDLLSRPLDAARRRHLLQRLTRTNRPEVVALIAADLDEKSSRGFGSLPVHSRLTRPQLDELARLRPQLRVNPAWVVAMLARLLPPSHVDWQTDLAARDAALAVLWATVGGLAAAFNSLKAQVLYHQLDLDRRLGRVDRERFLRYLSLPRQADYARDERLRGVPPEQLVAPGAEGVPGLEPVYDDEALVAEYLEQFLVSEDSAAFAEWLRADWLEERLATARLLAGAADAERWAALLGPARLADLRDRVDIELTVRNPARFPAEAPVALEVDLKNVPQLLVKTFRIDPVAYFLASRGAEVDTAIDLDGMVASDERVVPCDAPAIRRVRQRIDLPGCARPGTYVIELIGNGISSRALIRKGALRYSLRVGVAGPVVRVLDEGGRPAAGARIWLGGREYAPREDGAIAIPFSTTPGPVPMLLVDGGVAQREVLQHPAERFQFSAGLHLEREALVPDRTARVLLRPILTVAGWPAPLALVQEARVEIAVTDRAGTTSSRTQPLELSDDAETVIELQVPADVATISLTVRGRVRVASTQQTIDVADGARADIGAIHDNPHTESLHLARTDRGHLLQLLGKSGEPRAGRAIPVSLKHAAVGFELSTTLETDAEGRIELGALEGIERITATAGMQQSWTLWPDREPARTVHALAGAPLVLPRPPGVSERDLAASLALIELRGGQPAHDATARISVSDRALVIDDLEPGDYLLQSRGGAEVRIGIAPAQAPVADRWALTATTSLELSPPAPVLASLAVSGDHVAIRIAGAGPATRVHLIATRFLPEAALPRSLEREPRPPMAAPVPPVVSHYLSGRDIGDEYRYLLERRTHPRRPGVLLDKPGLLLNPWAIRTTSTGVQHAQTGGAYATSPARPAAGAAPAAPRPLAKPGPVQGGYTAVDFLPSAAVVLANLRPDARGELRVPLADLGDAQSVRVLVVDPAATRAADLPLAERPLRPRDLRLRLALDAGGHFVEVRRAEAAPAGARLVVEDVRSGKLELVDTTARAHQVLLSFGAPDAVRELGFLAQWHALDDAARRDRYARFACHEVHLFLYFRDRTFFDRVVGPYLAHKRDKTFLDRCLLGEPLDRYLEPWAFGRLNALERVLLARQLGARGDGIARLLGDAVDLIPPDPERDARLIDTLLGQAALESSGIADAAKDARERAPSVEKAEYKKRARESDAPMAAPAAPPPAQTQTRAPGGFAANGYGGDQDEAATLDFMDRERSAPLYRAADKTQEWAESNWWRVRESDATAELIPVNRFWRDLARHDPATGPFLSPYLGDCTESTAAALAALAVLDLPFVAGAHDISVEESRLTVTCASHALAARTAIAAVSESEARSPILVGQSYFRADDRWEWDGAEQREKYVTGELLVGVVYQCQVVVTNPTSRNQKLEVLLQIPRGAMPVSRGFYTRTVHLHLGAYGTQAIDYGFYFPAPGRWSHFPAHVSRAGELAAFAAPSELEVVAAPTRADTGSWAHVSQHGTLDEVLAFLDRANLGRVDLDKIAWRMADRAAFTRVTALLAARHVYCDRLWAYGLRHADRDRVAEWLRHQDHVIDLAGPVLEGALIGLDPIERVWYEHLEYAPLINARAHQLGPRRTILNDALASQYQSLLEIVAHKAAPGGDDLLAAAHYLFCLDRIDDALAVLDRVRPEALATRLQHDYLAAWAACARGDLAAARRLAAPWGDHPVDRWRHRYAALAAMLDEASGGAAAGAIDADSRGQRMDEMASRQPTLELAADKDAVLLQHHNLAGCQLRFYRVDIELLFSRSPFVQGDIERFSWIEPGAIVDVALTGAGRTSVPIPAAMRGANLVVQASAPGLVRSIAHYAHDLAAQLAHQYGQIRVLRATSQAALPASYVKVYARDRGGAISFYKDGYTDLRGRFDYATLSTDDLDRVERFAILVVSDQAGATVLEAAPPPR